MKINFNRKFSDYKNSEMDGGDTMASALAQHLFAGTGFKPTGDEASDMRQKYEYYCLSQKLQRGEEDYSTEELTSIKKVAASAFVPGAYGQIYELIEKGE